MTQITLHRLPLAHPRLSSLNQGHHPLMPCIFASNTKSQPLYLSPLSATSASFSPPIISGYEVPRRHAASLECSCLYIGTHHIQITRNQHRTSHLVKKSIYFFHYPEIVHQTSGSTHLPFVRNLEGVTDIHYEIVKIGTSYCPFLHLAQPWIQKCLERSNTMNDFFWYTDLE